ncbi:MAG: Lrp/AsnC family transcriptional regulator [Proteobacteria bacterium]|jgi:Lrp/AsnC family transcriptional regulator|nr:Lrp/AsnC family transcriptional regulator [Pseudomonadota bacterium]MDA1238881.1 Lrp/AsnC family transcriptional regulator [Pseudomonadota bacterium]
MTYNIDNIDRKILNQLQRDAGLSMDALADRVNLSRNACWRRVSMMEKASIIRARVVIVDPKTLDLELTVFVMIRSGSHDSGWITKFEKVVNLLPEIIGAHRMSGDLDYILKVRVSDVKGYDKFYKNLISKIQIADISASFVMDDIKETTALPTFKS